MVLRAAATKNHPAPKSVDGHLGEWRWTSHVVALPDSHSESSRTSAGLCRGRRAVLSSGTTTCPAGDTSSLGGHRDPSTGLGGGNAGSHPLVPALPPGPRDLHESLPPSRPSFTRWSQKGVWQMNQDNCRGLQRPGSRNLPDPRMVVSAPRDHPTREALDYLQGSWVFLISSLFALSPHPHPTHDGQTDKRQRQPQTTAFRGPLRAAARGAQAGRTLFHFWNSSAVRAAPAVNRALFTEAGPAERARYCPAGPRAAAVCRDAGQPGHPINNGELTASGDRDSSPGRGRAGRRAATSPHDARRGGVLIHRYAASTIWSQLPPHQQGWGPRRQQVP